MTALLTLTEPRLKDPSYRQKKGFNKVFSHTHIGLQDICDWAVGNQNHQYNFPGTLHYSTFLNHYNLHFYSIFFCTMRNLWNRNDAIFVSIGFGNFSTNLVFLISFILVTVLVFFLVIFRTIMGVRARFEAMSTRWIV